MIATFSGTVTACTTRYQVTKPTTAYLTHFDASWILTLAITAADPTLPFAAGAEVSFAIHSPVQLLFDAADECLGRNYDLSVELGDPGPRWQTLRQR